MAEWEKRSRLDESFDFRLLQKERPSARINLDAIRIDSSGIIVRKQVDRPKRANVDKKK